ncbi:MAG: hypothetical protein ACLRWH_01410 [Emergencia sp.]
MESLISPRGYKLLKKCRFLPLLAEELGKTDREICEQLVTDGLLEGGLAYCITEKGRAVLRAKFNANIPNILSATAIIISIIALIRSW